MSKLQIQVHVPKPLPLSNPPLTEGELLHAVGEPWDRPFYFARWCQTGPAEYQLIGLEGNRWHNEPLSAKSYCSSIPTNSETWERCPVGTVVTLTVE